MKLRTPNRTQKTFRFKWNCCSLSRNILASRRQLTRASETKESPSSGDHGITALRLTSRAWIQRLLPLKACGIHASHLQCYMSTNQTVRRLRLTPHQIPRHLWLLLVPPSTNRAINQVIWRQSAPYWHKILLCSCLSSVPKTYKKWL